MTYNPNAVIFYKTSNPTVTWPDEAGPALQDATHFQASLLADLSRLNAGSVKARSLLDLATSGTSVLRIAGLAPFDSHISPAFARNSSNNYTYEALQINYDLSDDVLWFNTRGALVQADRVFVIAHELSHLVEETADPLKLQGDVLVSPSDDEQNAAGFDYKGGAVRTQNIIARQMDNSDQQRASYQATYYNVNVSQYQLNYSYTNDQPIDVVRFGSDVINNQDHTLRNDNSRDLFFGFGGSDIMKGAGGDDWLYAGAGADTMEGGDGNDTLYGEAENDSLKGGLGADYLHGGLAGAVTSQQSALEADGVDTADYSADAVDGVAIRINDQDINALLAVKTDAAFGTWVTNRARPGDVDLLISVETIKAT